MRPHRTPASTPVTRAGAQQPVALSGQSHDRADARAQRRAATHACRGRSRAHLKLFVCLAGVANLILERTLALLCASEAVGLGGLAFRVLRGALRLSLRRRCIVALALLPRQLLLFAGLYTRACGAGVVVG